MDPGAEHAWLTVTGLAAEDFRLLFESVPRMYLVLTRELHIVAVSDAYLRATMTEREVILGRHLFEVFPANPEDPAATGVRNLQASLDRVIQQHVADTMAVQKYDIRRPASEGGGFEERFWSPVNSPVLRPDGTLAYIIHRVEDVTEVVRLTRREHELQLSEERFRQLVESADDAILILDPTGLVLSWNAGAERIKGYQAREIVGQHFSRFYPREEIDSGTPERALGSASAAGRFEDEGWRVRKDGSTFLANVVITALRDETGVLQGFGKVTRDLTERRRNEEEVRRLNEALERRATQLMSANLELEAFAYSVSHDLRAPLRSIDGFSQALVEDAGPALPEDARRHLDRIRAATLRMSHLIDDMLALSKVSRAEMKRTPVDLSDLAARTVAALRHQAPTRDVTVTIAPDMTAEGDARLLQVALENLLDNAWKFTSRRDRPQIEVGRTSGQDSTPIFFVRDNGTGFDPAYADKLFGPFERLHAASDYPGTGIGLATVQRIVHRHGGRVWAEAEPNRGACFYFTLG